MCRVKYTVILELILRLSMHFSCKSEDAYFVVGACVFNWQASRLGLSGGSTAEKKVGSQVLAAFRAGGLRRAGAARKHGPAPRPCGRRRRRLRPDAAGAAGLTRRHPTLGWSQEASDVVWDHQMRPYEPPG